MWLYLALGIALGAMAMVLGWMLDRQGLVREAARLQAERDAALRGVDEERLALARNQLQLREAFASLSKDALKENATSFLQTADQTFRARQEAIETLLGPVRETLDRVQTQMVEIDKSREGSFREVRQHLTSLAQSQRDLQGATEGLSKSLRSPNTRGVWGEVQLRRVVELAGMLQHCDFTEKPSAMTADGSRQTPDLIVNLPGGSSIIVDAKVPIDGYLKAAESTTEEARVAHMAQHAKQVRDHIRVLGAKEYWRQFQPAPEMIVMFLPIEPLLSAAFEQDGTLLEMAASLRVVPASPMTLLAILRAVAFTWRQQAVAQNAEEIQLLGRDLYERLATMVAHLERVGSSLKQAADSYDGFIGSLEQKVLPGARKFKELGVSTAKEIEMPEPLNLSVRRVRKDELTGEAAKDIIEADAESLPLLRE